MHRINKNTAHALFITTSKIKGLSYTTKSLVKTARQAHTSRRFDVVDSAADKLLELSAMTEQHGLLFKAFAKSKHGHGDPESATKMFNHLVESPFPAVRAASLLALSFAEMKKNCRLASSMLNQSLNLAIRCKTPVTYIQCHNTLSLMLAENGDFEQSVNVLLSVAPMVKQYALHFPALLGELNNNLACAYLEMGEVEKALYYSINAIANPLALNFPEWFETKQAVDNKALETVSKAIYLRKYNRLELLKDWQIFPSPVLLFQVYLKAYDERFKLLDYYVNGSQESDTRFTALLGSLSENCTNSKTSTEIVSFFQDNENIKFQKNISSKKLDALLKIFRNVEQYELDNPLPLRWNLENNAIPARNTFNWFIESSK